MIKDAYEHEDLYQKGEGKKGHMTPLTEIPHK